MIVLATVVGLLIVSNVLTIFFLCDTRSAVERQWHELSLLSKGITTLRKDSIPTSELVPLRDKCDCGHTALMHNTERGGTYLNTGCGGSRFGIVSCFCPASRNDVLYTPRAMKSLT